MIWRELYHIFLLISQAIISIVLYKFKLLGRKDLVWIKLMNA